MSGMMKSSKLNQQPETVSRRESLLRAGGGLSDSAYADDAELTRYIVGPNGERETQLLEVDLAAAMSGDASATSKTLPFATEGMSASRKEDGRGSPRYSRRCSSWRRSSSLRW